MKRTPLVPEEEEENGNGETIVSEIEKGVSIPEVRVRNGAKYPLKEMKKGDSFAVTNTKKKEAVLRNILYGAIASYRKRFPDKKFIVRKEKDHTYRVWRIK